MLCTGLFPNADTKIQHRRRPLVHFGTISTSCALFGSIMHTFARKRMQQNSDMVQPTNSDGSVCESRRLEKSTDTTPLAYVVESLTRCSRILNPTQPYL